MTQVPSNVIFSMAAKFRTKCPNCDTIIEPGNLIFKIPDGDGFNWCTDPFCNNPQPLRKYSENAYIVY